MATLYFWLFRRRRDEQHAGLLAMSSMRWREFSQLVLAAMEKRGLKQAPSAADESRMPKASFVLTQGNQRWLLSCKHGSAYRIGSSSVEDLAASVRLTGVNGAILVTDGHVQKSGREAVLGQRIELLHGNRLWREIKPLLPLDTARELLAGARQRAIRHSAIAWLAALALGALVSVGMQRLRQTDAPAPIEPAAPATATAAAAPAATVVAATDTDAGEPSEQQLESQRADVLRAINRIDGIARASWLTRMTLSVDLSAQPEDTVWPRICQQLELYPALSTVRVQLNPPAGSERRVRWRQCQTM
ncbi:restriction endonuclease [Pseudoxanthomonas dokdonensis]|uniref:restriction endonuclease n=1 Tax=Pseudoxanthomonas dokdonensis TaxID=344882 RepID=UPI00070C8E71|nr:restriction endonuclease [Pseudoxanthomonas dokdonensis]